jgi:hypothetical protein
MENRRDVRNSKCTGLRNSLENLMEETNWSPKHKREYIDRNPRHNTVWAREHIRDFKWASHVQAMEYANIPIPVWNENPNGK